MPSLPPLLPPLSGLDFKIDMNQDHEEAVQSQGNSRNSHNHSHSLSANQSDFSLPPLNRVLSEICLYGGDMKLPPLSSSNHSDNNSNNTVLAGMGLDPGGTCVIKPEHQPPGLSRTSDGGYHIPHLNLIGPDELDVSPTDKILGQGYFGKLAYPTSCSPNLPSP